MSYQSGLRAALATGSLLALSGCVGALLGGGKPDALYRFGTTQSQTISQQIALPRRILAVPTPNFSPAAGGDRILTSQGSATSYIKDMRWVTAAPTLYAASIEAIIAERAPDIVVAGRGSAGRADAVLTVTVDRFEAVYSSNGIGLPTIQIDGNAVLFDLARKKLLGRYKVSVSRPVAANSGSAIAAAFDAAVRDSVIQVVDWTNVTMSVTMIQNKS